MKKTIIYIIGLIFLIVLIATTVYAVNLSNAIETEIIASDTQLKGGQEVVVTLKFNKYNGIVKGINAFKANLEYNEELFEEVKKEDFITQNNWEELQYNGENKEFIAIKKAGSKSAEEIVKITLKVKTNAEAANTNVSITNVLTSEGKEDMQLNSTSVSLDIIKDQEEKPDEPAKITSERYEVKQGYIDRISPETDINTFKQNATANRELTFLDKEGNILAENSKLATGTKVKVGDTLEYTLIVIGDIDGNGKLTPNDLAKLKLHYIGTELLEGIELDAADVDNNNKLSANDLAKMKLVYIGSLKPEELK